MSWAEPRLLTPLSPASEAVTIGAPPVALRIWVNSPLPERASARVPGPRAHGALGFRCLQALGAADQQLHICPSSLRAGGLALLVVQTHPSPCCSYSAVCSRHQNQEPHLIVCKMLFSGNVSCCPLWNSYHRDPIFAMRTSEICC